MTGAAGKDGGHIPAGYMIWITVNKYVALLTYLLQEQFFTQYVSRERKQKYAFCVRKTLKFMVSVKLYAYSMYEIYCNEYR